MTDTASTTETESSQNGEVPADKNVRKTIVTAVDGADSHVVIDPRDNGHAGKLVEVIVTEHELVERLYKARQYTKIHEDAVKDARSDLKEAQDHEEKAYADLLAFEARRREPKQTDMFRRADAEAAMSEAQERERIRRAEAGEEAADEPEDVAAAPTTAEDETPSEDVGEPFDEERDDPEAVDQFALDDSSVDAQEDAAPTGESSIADGAAFTDDEPPRVDAEVAANRIAAAAAAEPELEQKPRRSSRSSRRGGSKK